MVHGNELQREVAQVDHGELHESAPASQRPGADLEMMLCETAVGMKKKFLTLFSLRFSTRNTSQVLLVSIGASQIRHTIRTASRCAYNRMHAQQHTRRQLGKTFCSNTTSGSQRAAPSKPGRERRGSGFWLKVASPPSPLVLRGASTLTGVGVVEHGQPPPWHGRSRPSHMLLHG